MKKYIVIYHATEEAMKEAAKTSSEEAKESMKPWMEWKEKIGDAVVDMGNPLGNGQKLSKSGTTSSDREVVGYSILQAENMDDAVELLKGHPHLEWNKGCDIEIHEAMPLPGSEA